MSNIKHLFWDWNGTLLDDTWLCHELLCDALERYGLELLDFEAYRERFNFPMIEFYQSLGFDVSEEAFVELSKEWLAAYESRCHECQLQAAAADILPRLQATGVRQAILSAYNERDLRKLVCHHGLDAHLEQISGAKDIYGGSKTEAGRALLAELGAKPEETAIIGDTLHDFEVSQAIGAQCVLVSCGNQSAQRLAKAGVPVAATLTEAVECLSL